MPFEEEIKPDVGFVEVREDVLAALERLGDRLCAYSGGAWRDRRCDCKYGAGWSSEQTGCPEVRVAFGLLSALSDEEYRRLARRAGGEMIDELFTRPVSDRRQGKGDRRVG